jgi:hypothetical protein
MLGFSLARISYLNIAGDAPSSFKSRASPEEWYWYRQGHYRIGITLHLASMIPAGILMVWQFIPIIRHKAILFHRINGYTIIALVFFGNLGALMIARRAFGGTLPTQSAVGVLVIITTGAMLMAYYNIKRLQIDQHRAWMLRAMFYLGTIITMRIIMIIAAQVITAVGNYYTEMLCEEIHFIYSGSPNVAGIMYPQCAHPNMTTNGNVVVHADINSGRRAIFLHLIGVEIYLRLTPVEQERLRQISYEKQLKTGLKNPGSAGLTVDRWGDAEGWTAPEI